MKSSIIKNKTGITLVEILVAVAIIITLASASFLGTKTMSNGPKLKMSAQKLASDLRKMQSFVLNLQDHNGNFPDGGWGIVFYNHPGEESHYRMFADMNADSVFNDDGSELYTDIPLPAGINFTSWTGDGANMQPNSRMVISFQPPDPSVTLCRANNNNCIPAFNYDEVELTLSNTSGSTRTIEINKFGLIDVQN